MKYCSTRGKESGLAFRDVLFAGYAKDGGLYMPESIPTLTPDELESWSSCSYRELVYNITRKFIDQREIPNEDLQEIVSSCYKRFSIPEVVQIKKLGDGLNIVELFYGVTLAFKDLALSIVGEFLNYFLKKSKDHVTVLVGTSGDTGSAAIESVRGKDSMDIVVLLPQGRCTKIQELQMTAVIEDNVHVFCVDGNSDELDEPIKRVFLEESFVAEHRLICINSINWGRILAQIPHYFYIYYQLCQSIGDSVEVVVPTGAAGNITGGTIAMKMGLPIHLVTSVTLNDIVARTFQDGNFSVKDSVVPSLASAMDIQIPYNVERLLYLSSDGNTVEVGKLMTSFEENGKVAVPDNLLNTLKNYIKDCLVVHDDEITEVMKKVMEDHKYILCPHTATAVAYHYAKKSTYPRGIIATASPAKFPEAVTKAGGVPVTKGIDHLESLPTQFECMAKGQDWYVMLKNKIKAISSKRKG
ncbi:threonine synthase-like 2 isoform X2 [Oratosquilla oratoria]